MPQTAGQKQWNGIIANINIELRGGLSLRALAAPPNTLWKAWRQTNANGAANKRRNQEIRARRATYGCPEPPAQLNGRRMLVRARDHTHAWRTTLTLLTTTSRVGRWMTCGPIAEVTARGYKIAAGMNRSWLCSLGLSIRTGVQGHRVTASGGSWDARLARRKTKVVTARQRLSRPTKLNTKAERAKRIVQCTVLTARTWWRTVAAGRPRSPSAVRSWFRFQPQP